MHSISFLACTKVELWDLKVCIAANRGKFQSRAVTLTLIRQCPLLNLPMLSHRHNTHKHTQVVCIRNVTLTSSTGHYKQNL